MRSKLSLCLLLHVSYLATLKAFPASPTPASTPFQLPIDPSLGDRADTKFVTIYGLYDDSLHTSQLDTSKPKLAPITEAFMAMTRALATATGSESESASRSVKPSATPTPLHKMAPPSLGPGLAVRPTPVQSSIASTSSDVSPDSLDDLQRGARLGTHRLVVFGSVIAGVVFFGLLLFFLLDPRMMRKLCGRKVDNNLPLPSKKMYRRHPVPVTPIPSSDHMLTDDTEKAFFAKRDPGDVIAETLPTSKFSVCSSEYSQSEPDTPKSKSCPVRPPRPPTADSPALSESVYLAHDNQPYIIVAPQPFTDIDLSLDNLPTGPKMLSPREFFDMYNVLPEPISDDSNINITLSPCVPSNTTFYDTRHSRSRSAPLLVGSGDKEINDMPESVGLQRMLKHRRSRSASGWAYPDRLPS